MKRALEHRPPERVVNVFGHVDAFEGDEDDAERRLERVLPLLLELLRQSGHFVVVEVARLKLVDAAAAETRTTPGTMYWVDLKNNKNLS